MPTQDKGDSWFLAQLKPNCARIAQRNLDRQGFHTFLPLEEETRKRNGKFVTSSRPLFPGYLFVAFDPAYGLWRTVNSTYGVSRLVRFGAEPSPVPGDLIAHLMKRCDARGRLLPPEQLEPGDVVTLNRGPFSNFVVEVERILPERRIWVLMDIMGSQKRIEVGTDQVRVG